MKYCLIFVWGDVSPELYGPYDSEEEQDANALELRRKWGIEHGIYRLDVPPQGEPGVSSYSGGFFMDDDD